MIILIYKRAERIFLIKSPIQKSDSKQKMK